MDPQVLKLLEIINQPQYMILLLALMIWSLVWKGIALWKSAVSGQKKWFIALLIVNTIGILEIIYIFYFQAREEKKV